ncbi:uncharacterized protein N7515_000920 [Penicillium bovifimosum]|uniref:Uncharacterized protein n=1 Tax=Penicillium bovifimosum TaxID=126998 RepID=A0A9W9HGK8_9EURO|nr:uncharacterized protein N7515_000920 [Penicillium bovifimosum]KAJ5146356.1 hypothetical protein N7515_000920 [Penicillium bovifimosum]
MEKLSVHDPIWAMANARDIRSWNALTIVSDSKVRTRELSRLSGTVDPGNVPTACLASFGRSPPTEAKTRWLIDPFILHVYAAVTSDLTNAQPLNVQCERGYSFGPVKVNGKRVIFSGRMDYSIWYGETELLCLNVLVVEAKDGPKSGHALPQLLGYMGCIHRERKNSGRRNCGVYGMVYNEDVWHFLKISHDSKWSELAVGGRALERSFVLLVWMLRMAAAISPAHSTVISAEISRAMGHEEMNIDSFL